MKRIVQPELLDEMSSENPEAVEARRDLQWVNWWMGHAAIFRSALRGAFSSPPKSIVEIGAGDGSLLLRVAQMLRWDSRETTVWIVDREDTVSAATHMGFNQLGWRVNVVRSDVYEWWKSRGAEEVDLVVANLFLHHFEEPELQRLLRSIADHATAFVGCEPRRSALAHFFARQVWLIGANRVTRVDAVRSVEAGFNETELINLWPRRPHWKLTECRAGLFSHFFAALKCPDRAPVG